jgi:hypothetical protein
MVLGDGVWFKVNKCVDLEKRKLSTELLNTPALVGHHQ